MDANTHQVLCAIYSVGFLPNGNCPYAIAYGTNPFKMNHERELPYEFANREVYIKFSVHRYEPTPYSMFFKPTSSRLNLSTVHEYVEECEYSGYSCNFDRKKFDYYYYKKICEYMDSIVAATGRKPYLEEIPMYYFPDIDSNYMSKIMDRYYNRHYDSTTGQWYWYIPPKTYASRIISTGESRYNEKSTIVVDKIRFIDNSSTSTLTIKLKLNNPLTQKNFIIKDLVLELYNLQGQHILTKTFEQISLQPSQETQISVQINENCPKELI